MPSNYQPYLTLNYLVPLYGVYPARNADTWHAGAKKFAAIDPVEEGDVDGGIMSASATMGMVRIFAGNYAPNGDATASGQLIPISQNTALFSLLGTYYGGNGTTNFALPNLGGRIPTGDHQGPGLQDRVLGEQFGTTGISLQQYNLPFSSGGVSVGVDDTQPSLAMHYMISAYGIYPSQNGDVGGGIMNSSVELIGLVSLFAGNFTPVEYLECNGQLLSIAEYDTLFSLIGTTYGGDGVTTFAVPDLRGRAVIGAGTGNNGVTHYLGEVNGVEGATINQYNLPVAMGGSGIPITNDQPTVALNYIIALQGLYPSRSADVMGSADSSESYLGEIAVTATNFAPRGWALCAGQLLSIAQNQALFSILGTTYGGNGITTFALPDLRGRVAMGTDGNHPLGETGGSDTFTLTMADIPALNFQGDANPNALYGGDLSDTIGALGGNDTVTGNGGNDTLGGGDGDDTLNGNLGGDFLNGDNGNDSLNGGDGTDTLTGAEGNDALDGGLGNDTMTGGNGDDTYYAEVTSDRAIEANGTAGGIDLVIAVHSFTLGGSVENLTFTGYGAVNGTGNSQDNVITGNGGVNTLSGLAGNDTLDGGSGNDTLIGGIGDDVYIIAANGAGDVVTENLGEGTDTVRSAVDYTLGANLENLVLTGTAVNGTGNELNNAITGNASNNVLRGLDGNDILTGDLGNDTMYGGTGNDTYYVDSATDLIVENLNEGTDAVFASVSFRIDPNIDSLTLIGSALWGTGNGLANTITGNSGDNTLDGKSGNDLLDGGLGNDTMIGGLGNDTYVVSASTDVCTENAGEGIDLVRASVGFSLSAEIENLTLIGSGNATGLGNTLNNVIIGNTGNNSLNGKTGNDTLTGGGGADTFLFLAASGVDTVTDFTTADTVNINAYTHGVANTAIVTQVGANTIIDLGGGNSVTLNNALKADVLAHMVW